MTLPTITADEIRWRPAMETVLGILADGRARTVTMIEPRADFGNRCVRDALNSLLHKGVIYRSDGRPAYYRINDYGRRLVVRDPKRFGL